MDMIFRTYGRLFARPVFYRLNRFLFNLSLRGLGILNWQTDHLQGEHDNLKAILPGAAPGSVVLDVGANNGDYSAVVAAIAPQIQIHAFEPHPLTFGRLSKRFAGTSVACHNFGLGVKAGTFALYDHAGTEGTGHATTNSGVIERIHGKQAQSVDIEIRRLDQTVESLGLTDIHLLKIDVEGAELDVLAGLGEWAERGITIRHIQIEFNEMNVVSGVLVEDFCKALPGYRINRILPGGALLDITDERPVLRELFAFQNLLFSRPDTPASQHD